MRVFLCIYVFLLSSYSIGSDTLTVGYTESAPFIFQEDDKLQGPMQWLWEHIADDNDFVCEYRYVPSDSVLHKLKSGDVEVALYPMTITSERSEYIDFSSPFYLAYSGVVSKEYSFWEKSWIFLSSFFSLNFFRVLAGLCLVILIFGFFAWLFERRSNKEEFGGGVRGLWSGFWWSAVTMTTVGYGDKSPRTAGGRVVALIWMFTAVIIISGFTASITSSLTVTELETDTSSINSFKNKKLGTVQNSGTLKWLNDNFFNDHEVYSTKEDLLIALNKNEVDAVVYDLPLLREMVVNDSIDEYNVLPIKFNPQYYALGLAPSLNDTLQKKINTTLLQNTESLEWSVVLAEFNLDTNK